MATSPRARWLDASATRFGIPVLDIASVTQGMMSTSSDPEAAARAMSWRESVGDELDVAPLDTQPETPCALRYPAHRLLPDGLVFTPHTMEEKWVIALRGDALIAARSWSGTVQAVARVRRGDGEITIDAIRFAAESGFDAFGDRVHTFDWLVRGHALAQPVPLPVDDDGAARLEDSPLSAFSLYGSRVLIAARGWAPAPPRLPLRSMGRVMQAMRRGDLDALRGLGESLDAPEPRDGFTALQIAALRNDLALARGLLELGADPNVVDDRGMSPLGRAIVHDGTLELLELFANAGARLDVANVDGFGLLHAAAETDRAEVVPWLLARGVALEARTRHGHTPLHIACGLGHVAAARALLDAGADRNARAPDGKDARAIAVAEHKPEAVALLDGVVN